MGCRTNAKVAVVAELVNGTQTIDSIDDTLSNVDDFAESEGITVTYATTGLTVVGADFEITGVWDDASGHTHLIADNGAANKIDDIDDDTEIVGGTGAN